MADEETTTIEITKSDRDRLDALRRYPREPYRSVVRRLLDLGEDAEPLSPETISEIRESLAEIERGEYVTHEDLKRDLGIE
jgi:predicted transcriptional regulator